VKPVENKEFFKFIFGDLGGYLCIVLINRRKTKAVTQKFFEYPDKLDEAIDFINKNKAQQDVYFAPFLCTQERRRKEDIAETPVVWSDGDTCPIESLLMKPSAIIRTSEGRHAFFWKFNEVQPPDVGESISKRIAYYHENEGMDKSGWDLTQLLRVPDSYNHKYSPPHIIRNAVVDLETLYEPADFSEYPVVEAEPEYEKLDLDTLPAKSAREILEQYKTVLNPLAFELFTEVPVNDWSKRLWNLELCLLEAGLSKEEAFVVASDAACNKYRREKRSGNFIWKEVQKAAVVVGNNEKVPEQDDPVAFLLKTPDLLTDDEKLRVKEDRTFVEEYCEWAGKLSDAAEQYHPAGAFTILSTLLSSSVKLPTLYGTVILNLWFMILADTTLTRKSTAMDIAADLILETDYDALLATDGSAEGMLTALGTRPGKASLFFRDEITGLVESIGKKDYMAGMMEMLTKLYDGKNMKRILRRETIDVRDPILIMLSGGIRNKMVDILDYKHIGSGFLPRFVFITAESDLTKIRPMGPPNTASEEGRQHILNQMFSMYQHYVVNDAKKKGTAVVIPKQWVASLTDDAWYKYNQFETKMLQFAMEYPDPSLMTPMMDRLAKSGLKCAVLIAASRDLKDEVVVEEIDILHAFKYIEYWAKHSVYMVANIGTTGDERKLQRVQEAIERQPGVSRSEIMRRQHLSAREAENMFATLEQRNVIRRDKRNSRAERIFPVS
jgi:ribosomal protein S25